ncbi:hypothetical protein J6590_043266 [Homalodisca vitripennis]|nr:hypothetical protein J6590_043266 [Homalodisca vitripennis]
MMVVIVRSLSMPKAVVKAMPKADRFALAAYFIKFKLEQSKETQYITRSTVLKKIDACAVLDHAAVGSASYLTRNTILQFPHGFCFMKSQHKMCRLDLVYRWPEANQPRYLRQIYLPRPLSSPCRDNSLSSPSLTVHCCQAPTFSSAITALKSLLTEFNFVASQFCYPADDRLNLTVAWNVQEVSQQGRIQS